VLRITVCSSCAHTNEKIRKTLKKLRKEHGEAVEIVKTSCLDACKRDPAVRVGKKLLAPAKRKKLRRAVARQLAARDARAAGAAGA
jgi:NADH:ubiquinone oxidoreductase subunit E